MAEAYSSLGGAPRWTNTRALPRSRKGLGGCSPRVKILHPKGLVSTRGSPTRRIALALGWLQRKIGRLARQGIRRPRFHQRPTIRRIPNAGRLAPRLESRFFGTSRGLPFRGLWRFGRPTLRWRGQSCSDCPTLLAASLRWPRLRMGARPGLRERMARRKLVPEQWSEACTSAPKVPDEIAFGRSTAKA